MDKLKLFDPSMYEFETYALHESKMAYLKMLRIWSIYTSSVFMTYSVNNTRRFRGLKPLRKRTWKKLKGS